MADRKKPWHATGKVPVGARPLKPQHLKKLLSEIRRQGYEVVETDELQERVGQILGTYDATRQIASGSSLSGVRARIEDASEKTLALLESFRVLDEDSSRLIKLTRAEYQSLFIGLLKFSAALNLAREEAAEFSNGRPPDIARQVLAAEVGVLYIQIFDTMPTSSKDGAYVAILGIILEAATGKGVSEVHALAARGVEAAKKLLER